MSSSIDLAALLCSRLCHDMLSPVGAINNGLELLADEKDPAMRQQCMELLEKSAQTSAAKLKFFRLAFGAAGGYGERVPAEEPEGLVRGLAAGNERLECNWQVETADLPKTAVKVLLNLAAIGIDALPRGGTLDIGAEERDGATEIVIRAAGPKIAFDKTVGQALDGTLPLDELTGRTAPAHMIHALAKDKGGGLQYALGEDALVMGAVLPEG